MTLDFKYRLPESLDPEQLDYLPESMGVKRIQLEEYRDWDGDDAIRATVVLHDPVNLQQRRGSGKDVLDLQKTIQDKIREYGREEFAYVHIASESELEEDTVDPLE